MRSTIIIPGLLVLLVVSMVSNPTLKANAPDKRVNLLSTAGAAGAGAGSVTKSWHRLWDLSLNVNFRSPYSGALTTDTTNNLQARLLLRI